MWTMKDVDGDGVEEYRMPPIWEYARRLPQARRAQP